MERSRFDVERVWFRRRRKRLISPRQHPRWTARGRPCGFSLTFVEPISRPWPPARTGLASGDAKRTRAIFAARAIQRSHQTPAAASHASPVPSWRRSATRATLRNRAAAAAIARRSFTRARLHVRHRSWGSPFAVLVLPASDRAMFPSDRSHMPFPERPVARPAIFVSG
jgi:hypothetical protein